MFPFIRFEMDGPDKSEFLGDITSTTFFRNKWKWFEFLPLKLQFTQCELGCHQDTKSSDRKNYPSKMISSICETAASTNELTYKYTVQCNIDCLRLVFYHSFLHYL